MEGEKKGAERCREREKEGRKEGRREERRTHSIVLENSFSGGIQAPFLPFA
jgi:hypothetical protein